MTKKLTDLTEVTTTEDGDLLLIRDATDGVDKKMQAQNLRAKATTKDDVGLANVPDLDTADAVNKAHDQNTDTALDQGGANEVTAADARAHIDSTSNPHSVTKTQVGLGDVDNVSAADLRDRATHTGTQTLSTISDAGTIASQDADSVNIDGGTIDGTAVNATDLAYSGTLTGGTGVVNLGSGQVYKDASGNVGIGNSIPSTYKGTAVSKVLAVGTTSGANGVNVISGTTSTGSYLFSDSGGNDRGGLTYFHTADILTVKTAGTERMRIDSSGNVGIGTTAPSNKLQVDGGNIQTSGLLITGNANSNSNKFGVNGNNLIQPNVLDFYSGESSKEPRFSFGKLGAGQHSWGFQSLASSGRNASFAVSLSYNGNNNPVTIFRCVSTGNGTGDVSVPNGNLSISGSLSKGSGSFKIDHPLKPETHHLVHSFVEGPQADLIYRGKVSLVNGQATVNIDEAGRMTEGTFEALNCNVQCFTNNESGWTCVRGSVSGNILTIEAQDETSTDEISWMVIGERCDQHMIDTDWTDDNGRVITEPEKEQQDAD